jgi:hypothetical protein
MVCFCREFERGNFERGTGGVPSRVHFCRTFEHLMCEYNLIIFTHSIESIVENADYVQVRSKFLTKNALHLIISTIHPLASKLPMDTDRSMR